MNKIVSTIILKNTYQRLEEWLFFGFLLTLPLSIRKILWYMPLGGVFNEYAEVSIYASDVFLIASLTLWIIKLNNTSSILSIVKECFTWNKKRIYWKKICIIFSPLVLILWSIFSFSYTINQFIGVFFIVKLIEWYGLYLFIIFHVVPHRTALYTTTIPIIKRLCQAFIFIGSIESIFGIAQFLHQKSLGLTLINESIVNPSMLGVAKIIVHGTHYIRAYGTFPHPNILGGFLMISIMMSHCYFTMFHTEQEKIFKQRILLGFQYVGLLLTFSKSAIIGLMIAYIYFKIVSRGTNNWAQVLINAIQHTWKKLFHVKQYRTSFIVGVGVFLISVILFQFDINALLFQSLKERTMYQSIAIDTIRNHPILGISCGQLVIFMSQQSIYPLLSWQLQPVHNVFLLIWAELGGVGFLIFAGWYVLLIMNIFPRYTPLFLQSFVQKNQSNAQSVHITITMCCKTMLLGLLPLLLFDHYLWDIQQGQGLFWIVVGISSGYILQHKK